MLVLQSCAGAPMAFAQGVDQTATDPGDLGRAGLVGASNYYGIASFFGKLVFWAGQLTTWTLNLNSRILETPTMRAGWVVSRDIANLGFVLAIILIAFMTILRLSSYQMKTVLWKLIVAALLVNFSLVIAGVFIDFSGVLTNFFISSVKNPERISEALAGTLSIQKFLQPPTAEQTTAILGVSSILTWGQALLDFSSNILFILIFTVTGAITLLGLAAMLFIRFVTVNILLILMPLAWLAWVLPGMSDQFGRWWKSFFRWVFFAPITSFFIYLTITTSQKLKGSGFTNLDVSAIADQNLSLLGSDIAQMIMSIGILVGGLVAANEMGIRGADATMKFAGTARGMILGGAGKLVTRPIAAAGAAGAGLAKSIGATPKDLLASFAQKGGFIQRYSARLAGKPLVGGIAQDINRWATTQRAERTDQYEKQFDILTKDKEAFLAASRDPNMVSNDARAAAYIAKAAEKGFINSLLNNPDPNKNIPKELFEKMILSSQRMGVDEKIYVKHPPAAAIGIDQSTDEGKKQAATKVREYVKKMKPEDFFGMNAKHLDNPAVFSGMTTQHIKYKQKNPDKITDEFEKTIENQLEKISKAISKEGRILEGDEKRVYELLKKQEDSPAAQVIHYTASKRQSGFTSPDITRTEK